ncbi:Peptidase family C25 [Bacteroidales bacterium Barb7]|nr:Peptidase family C25 [Bacteroidales bacterium Barb7]
MKRNYSIAGVLLFAVIGSFSAWAEGGRFAPQSVLAEGKWVKIEVKETGIYKLSYKDIQDMGFARPEQVSLYGYGGWSLEENLSGYIDDLPAVPVWRGADYLLFYGRGVVKWAYDDGEKLFIHTNNPYSTAGHYFLTDALASREMETAESFGGNASLQVRDYDDYMVHEKELAAASESGRELFGEYVEGSTPLNIPFSVPGILNETGKVTLRFISRPMGSSGAVSLGIGQETLIDKGVLYTVSDIDTKAVSFQKTADWTGDKTENVSVRLSYVAKSETNSRLDYVRLQMKRSLKPYGAFTFFRSLASVGNASRFTIREATANTMVLDVTDGGNPKRMAATLNGSELSFTVPAGALREFVIVQTDKSFSVPAKAGDVPNQNLHALGQTDMVVIVPPFAPLKVQAERLAAVHRECDNLTVEVVEPQTIYNEFSGGTPDATAYRLFLKMFYDRSTSEADKPKYLLLFGDGVFDNRALSGELPALYPNGAIYQRMLLSYQSEESIGPGSYVTDDYFGFLNDDNHAPDAGSGSYKPIAQWKLDIGVGRLPVRTGAQAAQVVDKLIGYMDNKLPGSWKNNVCFVADDGNNSDGYTIIHANQANQLADYLEDNHPEFLVNKVFFDAFKKDFSSTQNPHPDVRNRIQKLLKSGLLLINYSGHGGSVAWSDEKVLTTTDIAQFNYPCLPLWITATCDFSPFDATETSAGEMIMLNKSGGVALYTTTRLVYRTPNFIINNQLVRHLFDRKDGRRLTFGEVMKNTKNSDELYGDNNKLNFLLIGDPAMKLAYPEYSVQLTAVNGEPLPAEPFTLKALEKVTLEGEVLTPDGSRATDFNGSLKPTVLDSKTTLKTLNNNQTDTFLVYTDYPNTLFAGNDAVTNGTFRFSFIVPKDISYSNDDFGKINFYASDEQSGAEAQGAYLNFKVGGTAGNAEEDTEGPEIRALYLNDTTFTADSRVNTAPLFVAALWDKSGVNISGSSIGHDMMLIIDGNPALSYVLNDYYQTVPDGDGTGYAAFPLPALSAGRHFAEFIAWDVYNNSTRASFAFEAVDGLKPVLFDLKATPNPAREQAVFYFSHNRPEANMTVQITVFDMSGRQLWQHEERGSSDAFKYYTVTWDLTNSSGSRLRPGLYFYRASVTTDRSKKASKANKLIILAQ